MIKFVKVYTYYIYVFCTISLVCFVLQLYHVIIFIVNFYVRNFCVKIFSLIPSVLNIFPMYGSIMRFTLHFIILGVTNLIY